jgi:hypothetical protein
VIFDPDYVPHRRGTTQPATDKEVSERLAAQGERQMAAIYEEFGAIRDELAKINAKLDKLKTGEER